MTPHIDFPPGTVISFTESCSTEQRGLYSERYNLRGEVLSTGEELEGMYEIEKNQVSGNDDPLTAGAIGIVLESSKMNKLDVYVQNKIITVWANWSLVI